MMGRNVQVKRLIAVLALGALVLVLPHAGLTQSGQAPSDLAKEVEALKARQDAIEKTLAEIRDQIGQLRQARQAAPPGPPPKLVIDVDGAPFKGDKNAKVTLVEYTDYQCPFCGRHVRQTLPQIDKEFIQTGKVKYVLRDFPLESIHPLAFKASEAAYCAGEQGKYWEMHDRLFADQKAIASKDLPEHAQAIGLDSGKFQECLASGKHAAKIRAALVEGQKAGVRGTPAFFLGLTAPDGSKVKIERMISGAQGYPVFQAAIEELASPTK